jgi:AAA+ ATPase superfamily predicted ATPase
LFIERVYAEAMLQGRCRYVLVDDFDYETTKGFLRKYGFSDSEINLVWSYFGGKPVYLVEAIKNKHRLREFCEEMMEERFSVILYSLRALEDRDKELFKGVVRLFERFREEEVLECEKISIEVEWSVRQNILFLNPRKRLLRPQSKLDLLAIRRVLEVIGV